MDTDLNSLCERDEEWADIPSHSRSREDWRSRDYRPRCASHRPISTAKNFSDPFLSVLQRAAKHYQHIDIDPEILGGTPRITGTRIPVYMILDAIGHYGNLDGALTSYPHLTKDQVSEAVGFAAEVLENPVDH